MALYRGRRRDFRSGIRVPDPTPAEKGDKLAKPNYQYEKRQKDLAKKKKQEEKRLRKTNKAGVQPGETPGQVPGEGDAGPK